MNSFKEIMAQDISAVFMNEKEFADIYNIDGKDILAVLDTDLVHERNKRSYAEFAEGVNQGQITLFASRNDFAHVPVPFLNLITRLFTVFAGGVCVSS